MSQQQRDKVNDNVFEELDSDGLESKCLYVQNVGVFAALERKKISSPVTYWYYAAEKGHEALAKFATESDSDLEFDENE